MASTVSFSRRAANVFFHVLTRCNLRCRHCYINPEQHGRKRLPIARIERWLAIFAERCPGANVVFLGGEPTLHPDLPQAVRCARRLGFGSITIDTNGYLFNDILERVSPAEVDVFSFSLDGATPATNDGLRGQGSYATCLAGIRKARAKGFRASLIYTVSRANLHELSRMGPLLRDLGVERFFIQVLGLRGKAAWTGCAPDAEEVLRVSPSEWREKVPAAAEAIARRGVRVIYPKVFLNPGEKFECAGLVADNYFVFPNGRVYRCPLCEDFPVHSLIFEDDRLVDAPRLNENDFFRLNIAEGCVMNALIQPNKPGGRDSVGSDCKIACCLLKEEIQLSGGSIRLKEGSASMGALSLRRRIIALLSKKEMDARALSQELGIKEKEVYGHLAHVERSAAASGNRFVLTPSQCLLCGYVFEDRRRFTRPGRCPQCRRSKLQNPSFRILS